MDVMLLEPVPVTGPRPPAAPTRHLEAGQRWADAPELGYLGRILDQDTATLARVQHGLAGRGDTRRDPGQLPGEPHPPLPRHPRRVPGGLTVARAEPVGEPGEPASGRSRCGRRTTPSPLSTPPWPPSCATRRAAVPTSRRWWPAPPTPRRAGAGATPSSSPTRRARRGHWRRASIPPSEWRWWRRASPSRSSSPTRPPWPVSCSCPSTPRCAPRELRHVLGPVRRGRRLRRLRAPRPGPRRHARRARARPAGAARGRGLRRLGRVRGLGAEHRGFRRRRPDHEDAFARRRGAARLHVGDDGGPERSVAHPSGHDQRGALRGHALRDAAR